MADPKQGAAAAPQENPRAEAVREERRRRTDVSLEGRAPLDWPERLIADPRYVYHTFNDVGNRMHSKTVQDDWDIVRDVTEPDPDGRAEGAQARKLVGSTKDGKPIFAYLCRKRKDWFDEDFRKRQRKLDEQDQQIKTGKIAGSSESGAAALSADSPHAYVPSGGLSVRADTKEPSGYKP